MKATDAVYPAAGCSTPANGNKAAFMPLAPHKPERYAPSVSSSRSSRFDSCASNVWEEESPPMQQWSTGLFNCTDDVQNCCFTCCCPCIMFGRIAEIVDGGAIPCWLSGALYGCLACTNGLQCFYSWLYRWKLRQQYSLARGPCHEFLIVLFCNQCSLCQMHRELKNRGWDTTLGWRENLMMLRLRPAFATSPPTVEAPMSR